MKIIFKIFVLLFVFYNSGIYAQQKFHVEYNQIKGKLTATDKYKKDFGRYHGYEIPLYEGDGVIFIAYSEDFKPSLALVTPNGTVFRQNKNKKNDFVQINTTIPASGTWILFVIGDSSSSGNYELQYGFADKNSLSPGKHPDFCTALDFVLEHANAYFLLLDNPVDSRKTKIEFPGALDVFFDDTNGTYTLTFYQGNDLKQAQSVYAKHNSLVKKCLAQNFSVDSSKQDKTEEYKNTYVLFTEKTNQKPRMVKVDFYDFRISKTPQPVNFLVDISVGRVN